MLTRINWLLCTLLISSATSATVMAQTSVAEFQKLLREKAAFGEQDFAALETNQPVVRVARGSDKREVAVAGVVNIRAGAENFLKSYRESMTRRSNAAILEIGSFSREPTLADLSNLTIESRDIEDLKECVAGNCQVKLSVPMIERFRKEIDWNAADSHVRVTELFKQMLLEYVRDYRTRGDEALIEYNDKRNKISLAEAQNALANSPSYINDALVEQQPSLRLVEDALVWSKIKFGLKPVIAVNHIKIYQSDREVGPQVLIQSKQIYANHYFNASLALTAFVNLANDGAYLVYENRSRADGFEGPFSKIKKGVVEKKAAEGLKAILEHSKASLDGPVVAAEEFSSHRSHGWGQRLFGGIRPLLWLLMLSALIALLALGKRRGEIARSKALKPESAKS